MKRKIFLLSAVLLLLVGCSMANNPTSIAENLLSKYQKVDNDIDNGINTVIEEQNLTEEHKERYRKLLEKQYRNLSYEIKDERIDGNTATITAEIEVLDYKNAIGDLTFDSSIYTKDSFDEEKLNRLEATTNKVTYTIEFTLSKNNEDEWHLDPLTNEQIKKIQGMY